MRTQKFGIEIEMTGITRAAAAQVIAGHFDTSATHVGGMYDAFAVRDGDDRQWKVVSDSSIRGESRRGQSSNASYAVEFVSPICKYEDIETIQEIIRKLRAAGAKVNSSCGIHIHIDASPPRRENSPQHREYHGGEGGSALQDPQSGRASGALLCQG